VKQDLLRDNHNCISGGKKELFRNNDSCRCGNESCSVTATVVHTIRRLLKNNQNCSHSPPQALPSFVSKPSAQVGAYDAEEFELLTPMIRISLLTIFSKFGSKELLKKVRINSFVYKLKHNPDYLVNL
jgi:hypothetical protein